MDHSHKNIGIILELVKAPNKTWIVAFLMKFFSFIKASRYLRSVFCPTSTLHILILIEI